MKEMFYGCYNLLSVSETQKDKEQEINTLLNDIVPDENQKLIKDKEKEKNKKEEDTNDLLIDYEYNEYNKYNEYYKSSNFYDLSILSSLENYSSIQTIKNITTCTTKDIVNIFVESLPSHKIINMSGMFSGCISFKIHS